MKGKSLTSVVPGRDIVAKISGLMVLSIKEAVNEIENLPIGQIRGFLVETGIINDRFQVREMVDASLTFDGGNEYSAIISALEPVEIGEAINSSPEIFESGKFFLISRDDYNHSGMWIPVSSKQRDAIVASGDKKAIERLRNLHPEPWTKIGKEIGPWVMFYREVAVVPEIILGYISAIKNTNNRDEKWKGSSVQEIGLELVAYCANSVPEILDELGEISSALLQMVENIMSQPGLYYDACEKFLEGKTSIDSAAASILSTGDKSLDTMMAELRSIGIKKPTAEDVETLKEVKGGWESILKNGIPTEE